LYPQFWQIASLVPGIALIIFPQFWQACKGKLVMLFSPSSTLLLTSPLSFISTLWLLYQEFKTAPRLQNLSEKDNAEKKQEAFIKNYIYPLTKSYPHLYTS